MEGRLPLVVTLAVSVPMLLAVRRELDREPLIVPPPPLRAPSSSLGAVTMNFAFQDTRGETAVGQRGSNLIWVVDNLDGTWGPACRRAVQDAGAVVVNGKEAPWSLVLELGRLELKADMLGAAVTVEMAGTLARNGEQVWRKKFQVTKKIDAYSDLGKGIAKVLAPVVEDALERAGVRLTSAAVPAEAPVAAPAGQARLAVMDFRGPLSLALLQLVSDEARGGVLEGAGKRYSVLTREAISAALKDKTRCAAEEGCDVQNGKAAGADVVLTGDIVKLGRKLRVSVKVVDVRSGSLLASKSANADGEDALPDVVRASVIAAVAALPAP